MWNILTIFGIKAILLLHPGVFHPKTYYFKKSIDKLHRLEIGKPTLIT